MTFMNKGNRDRLFSALGGKKAGYIKTSIHNQRLHPLYVDDYTKETGIELDEGDRGFGNALYNTHFPVLYEIQRTKG